MRYVFFSLLFFFVLGLAPKNAGVVEDPLVGESTSHVKETIEEEDAEAVAVVSLMPVFSGEYLSLQIETPSSIKLADELLRPPCFV